MRTHIFLQMYIRRLYLRRVHISTAPMFFRGGFLQETEGKEGAIGEKALISGRIGRNLLFRGANPESPLYKEGGTAEKP